MDEDDAGQVRVNSGTEGRIGSRDAITELDLACRSVERNVGHLGLGARWRERDWETVKSPKKL